MLSIIHCDNCKKSGMFDIDFKFNIESHLCEKCHHHEMEHWDFYFCNINCLLSWLRQNEIEEKGLLCRDCKDLNGKPTGFRWGFESNGTCTTCNGAGRVKGHRKQEWEFRQAQAQQGLTDGEEKA